MRIALRFSWPSRKVPRFNARAENICSLRVWKPCSDTVCNVAHSRNTPHSESIVVVYQKRWGEGEKLSS